MKNIYLFPGQGSQAVGMGKDLYETYGDVKKLFDDANAILNIDIKKYCFEGPIEELTRTDIVQPAITLVNMAVFIALKARGCLPAVACGHSLGEYAALYAAGVFSAETVLGLVRLRGTYMQECAERNPGGMIAVIGLPIDGVRAVCAQAGEAGVIGVANFNTKEQIILSGVSGAVAKATEIIEAQGTGRVIPLKVSGPWHSPLMREAQDRMAAEIAKAHLNDPLIPVICNVTADYGRTAPQIRENLIAQITGSVRWFETVARLLSDHADARYAEVGPGRVLKGLMKNINRAVQVQNIENAASVDAASGAFAAS
ncbi:MAG TPA: ACP S-malonyltransferase [bacterium]|nr:ACP S-malonyltransferase [bacterium]